MFHRRLLIFHLLLGFFFLCDADRRAGAAGPPRRAVGRSFSPTGMMIRRESPEKAWSAVKLKEEVHTGDLLLALPFAAIDLKSDVRLSLIADMDGRTPFPAIESAVILHDNADVDLDFTLDRGRAAVANHKSTGAARVKVRLGDQAWTMTLHEPKTRVAIEIYGRWPRGVPFTQNPGPKDVPTLDAVVLVLSGQVGLKTGTDEFLMKAPPEGPAFLHWDSVTGADEPGQLPKVPEWAHADEGAPIQLKKKLARIDRFRRLVTEQSVEAAIDDALASDDPFRRRFGVYATGAVDDLKHLGDTIIVPKHADVWENGVLALRHWLGRCPGQDLKFYQHLVKERSYSPAHAEIVLQLCHSFGEQDLARPTCYEMLIDYLRHDKTPIRVLSCWHLVRLVPGGRAIKYDPTGAVEDRERVYQEWKKLIPDRQLPPEEK